MRFFISYSRSVKQEIGQVIKLLRAAGHDVWWDADIPIIEDWWATILKNIEWCEIFIFIVSEKSVQSPYCLEELRYAIARNRPILPFIVDDYTRYSIPPELGRRQWFVHDGDPARMLGQIMQACRTIDLAKYADRRSAVTSDGFPKPEGGGSGVPPTLPSISGTSEVSPIQFSAYIPKTLMPDDWQSLYGYVFREKVASTVIADAFERLGKKQTGYSSITKPGLKPLVGGAQITATPYMTGFQFNPVSVTIGFYDDWMRFDFRLRAKDALINQFATGAITFTVEGVIIADVPLSVYVGEAGGDTEINSAISRIYQAIFCSYSHKDTHIVERVESAYKALGLDYLRDVTTLKSGKHWSAEILDLIAKADIFQLFWSKSAMMSPYVKQEYIHALQFEKDRPNFIRPVWWKAPIAKVPSQLSHIHFAYQPNLDKN